MNFIKKLSIIGLLLLLGFNSFSQLIQIINTDVLRYDAATQSKYCKGNIKVLHEGIYIQCDSAVINDRNNTMDGMGNVYIYQPDTFDLRGKRVFYDGKTKMARVSGDVVLSDKEMVLTTPYIDYDTQNKTGSYSSGGRIVSNQDVLTSKRGYYNSRTSMASFRENVVLVNPEYTMTGDTLQYNTASSTAYFVGPTIIQSDENRIECISGQYNTSTNIASFRKRATIFGETSTISADSFFYNRNIGLGKAFRDIELHDTSEGIKVYGQQGLYMEPQKQSVVYGNPMSEKLMEDDTLLLLADTFYYYSGDTVNKRLEAFPGAKIYSRDMKGVCDTLIYRMQDSLIEMLREPVLWNENNQITGDTIRVYIVNKQISYMKVRFNGFIASWHEEDRFDQIKGDEIDNYFEDNKLSMVDVKGQAQSVYYSRDNDTGAYVGVNKIECGKMRVFIDSAGINNIRFYPSPSPDGKLYPPQKFPSEDKSLPGLNWMPERKPNESEFYKRKPLMFQKTDDLIEIETLNEEEVEESSPIH